MDGGVTTSQLPLDVYQNNTLLRRRNSISQSVVVATTCLDDLHQQTSSDASSGTLSSSSSASSSSSSSTSTFSASSGEFDLISVKPVSYVSLRDLLPSPAAVNSPKPKSPAQNHFLHPCPEISIRNRLVKQAAWAYLQPMSTAPDSSTRNFLHRLWDQFTTENPTAALFRFFNRHVFGSLSRFFDWLLRSICVRSSR